jgi:hypothetical protein
MTKKETIYMKDEPLARMGEMWAKLYYHLAKEMLTLEKGEEALRRAIQNYAIDRGETMREQAKTLGLPLNYETFQKTIKDMPFRELCDEMVKYYSEAEGSTPLEGFCAYAEFWRNYPDGWDVAKIYCDEFHHAKWSAFNPKFKVDIISVITKNEPCCILRSYIEGDEYDKKRKEELMEICAKAKKYGFTVDSSEHGDIKKYCQETDTSELFNLEEECKKK